MIKICQIKFEKLFCWQRRWLEEVDFKNRMVTHWKENYVHCLEKVEDLKRVFYYLVCWNRIWPHLQFHQLTVWKLPRRKSCISQSEVQSFKVLEHVGEGVVHRPVGQRGQTVHPGQQGQACRVPLPAGALKSSTEEEMAGTASVVLSVEDPQEL